MAQLAFLSADTDTVACVALNLLMRWLLEDLMLTAKDRTERATLGVAKDRLSGRTSADGRAR